ncbi:unnamed protein product [Eruca vesicaria subsp. sativa]|uniref:Uncharacterized protein n=1 Tax=Eruca vesicaria subsp. sativa TaxID=29727 RepID=A0ABC8KS46_ERUVS|nr:unnamed protein product [Eruca vesicaria subsp. sativa]
MLEISVARREKINALTEAATGTVPRSYHQRTNSGLKSPSRRKDLKSGDDIRNENCETDQEEELVEKMKLSPTSEAAEDEGLFSSLIMEKVAATKKYNENHYNKHMA